MAVSAANRIGRRAPLNLRTTDELRAKLEAAASEAGRNLTQEVERRLELSFEWERAFVDRETMLADLKARTADIEKGNLKAEMRRQGWTPIRGGKLGTAWVEPGTAIPDADGIQRSGFLDPEADARDGRWQPLAEPEGNDLEATIYSAVVRALRDARQESEAGA